MFLKTLIIVCAVTSVYSQAVGTCPPVDGDFPVYLPDATDCIIFYECSNGKPIQLQCAPGTLFDEKRGICAIEVNCGNRSTPKSLPADL
ncbi:peritrophin-1-like isoform X1 [Diabrotica virgifera virgifera]|uniref:Chitin-binding type-2 domain-containing protein n=1 Tax=Diabrotica virgifera virgifera TaxID=50390 RepID=A0ABM5JPK7_DIAVI|nr:peritrophin-1-like isoform X1 [Diabrotica virgifera virgifera]